MSKYLLNKFLYTIDRDPELVERYRDDPQGTVAWWEAERANVILNVPEAECSTWLAFEDTEREALASHVLHSASGTLSIMLARSASHQATVPCGSSRYRSTSSGSRSIV